MQFTRRRVYAHSRFFQGLNERGAVIFALYRDSTPQAARPSPGQTDDNNEEQIQTLKALALLFGLALDKYATFPNEIDEDLTTLLECMDESSRATFPRSTRQLRELNTMTLHELLDSLFYPVRWVDSWTTEQFRIEFHEAHRELQEDWTPGRIAHRYLEMIWIKLRVLDVFDDPGCQIGMRLLTNRGAMQALFRCRGADSYSYLTAAAHPKSKMAKPNYVGSIIRLAELIPDFYTSDEDLGLLRTLALSVRNPEPNLRTFVQVSQWASGSHRRTFLIMISRRILGNS